MRLRSLAARHHGARAFVMGNGPSLLKCDLNALSGDITVVSNAHYLIWDQLDYTPHYLAVEDVLVAEDRADELKALEGVTRVFPFDLRDLLGPANETKLYVHFPRTSSPWPRFSDDISRRAFWGGTVSFLNLQLAAYIGCDPIILIGFDHSYKVPEGAVKNNVITSDASDVNHIHPSYFGPGYRWHDPNVARMEEAYVCARDHLARRGVKVFNATVGGELEVFPRASYDALVAR